MNKIENNAHNANIKLKDSLNYSLFATLNNHLIKKILLESYSPQTREVCKIFKIYFDSHCLPFILKQLEGTNPTDLMIRQLLMEFKDVKKQKSTDFDTIKHFTYSLRSHYSKTHLNIKADLPFPHYFPYCSSENEIFQAYKTIKFENVIQEMRNAVEDSNLVELFFCTSKRIDENFNNWVFQGNFSPKAIEQEAQRLRIGFLEKFESVKSIEFTKDSRRFKNLTAHDGKLFCLPRELTELRKLTNMKISDQELHFLPEEFSRFTRVVIAIFDNNQLTKLPDSMGNLTSLRGICAINNKIVEIPDTFSKLSILEVLKLSNNRITSLPNNLTDATALKSLFLSQNQLSYLPDTLRKWTVLGCLDLSNNHLTFISSYIGDLSALKYLFLSKNQLSKLPIQIGNLTKLKTLEVSSNCLSEIPATLCRLTNLESLKLDGNKDLKKGSFGTLASHLPKLNAPSRDFLETTLVEKIGTKKRKRQSTKKK